MDNLAHPMSTPSVALPISDEVLRDRTQDVPPETMTRIFTLACEERGVIVPVPRDGHPWFIGHVCSRWRQILWDIPSIWNRIVIGFYTTPIPPLYSLVYADELVERLIVLTSDILSYILSKRSGTISLSVGSDGWQSLGELLDIVLEHFPRFAEVSIHGILPSQLPPIFDLPTSAFAQLEKLSLSCLAEDDPSFEYTTSPLQTAPILRRVSYDIPSFLYIPSLLLLPWATIQHLCVKGMSIPPGMILHILRSCPALESCELPIDPHYDVPFTTQEPILPALKVLSLRTEDEFEWDEFLSVLTAPALESLALRSTSVPCEPVVSFVTRSLCPVVNLNIDSLRSDELDDDEGVELLLDHLPSLASFYGPWRIPPSIFRKISTGALPALENARVFVDPDGLSAFLDVVDTYIDPPRRWPGNLTIIVHCSKEPGWAEQRNRYLEKRKVYDSVEGLRLTIFDFEFDLERTGML